MTASSKLAVIALAQNTVPPVGMSTQTTVEPGVQSITGGTR
jgi:hypothetical protein